MKPSKLERIITGNLPDERHQAKVHGEDTIAGLSITYNRGETPAAFQFARLRNREVDKTYIGLVSNTGTILISIPVDEIDWDRLQDNRSVAYMRLLKEATEEAAGSNLNMQDISEILENEMFLGKDRAPPRTPTSETDESVHYDSSIIRMFRQYAPSILEQALDELGTFGDKIELDTSKLPPHIDAEIVTIPQQLASARRWANRRTNSLGINVADIGREAFKDYTDLIHAKGFSEQEIVDYFTTARFDNQARRAKERKVGEVVYDLMLARDEIDPDMSYAKFASAIRKHVYKLSSDRDEDLQRLFVDGSKEWLAFAYAHDRASTTESNLSKILSDIESDRTSWSADSALGSNYATLAVMTNLLSNSPNSREIVQTMREQWLQDVYVAIRDHEMLGVMDESPNMGLSNWEGLLNPTKHVFVRQDDYWDVFKQHTDAPQQLRDLHEAHGKELPYKQLRSLGVDAIRSVPEDTVTDTFRWLRSSKQLQLPEPGTKKGQQLRNVTSLLFASQYMALD